MDLLAERHDVRQAARRNTFTGKTYNSVENISQFFGRAGDALQSAHASQAARRSDSAARRPPPAALAAPPPRRATRAGMTVEHPKYGTGTVVRREGEGEDAKITVNFPRYGLKKLVERYAGLKRN